MTMRTPRTSSFNSRRGLARKLAPLALVLAAGLLLPGASSARATSAVGAPDPYAYLPATLKLTGIVRDFKWCTETKGHPDYEYTPTQGFAHYVNCVADDLDNDGKPVFKSTGNAVTQEAMNKTGQNIMPVAKAYMASRTGDVAGAVSSTAGGALTNATNFSQWFRDVPGVNLSAVVNVTLNRNANTNTYTFDDKVDATYKNKGGFFPIDGQLFGNSPGQSHNFGFSFELSTTFTYKKGTGQVFTFTGDDDVYVFVGGKLVTDLGGVHSALNQTIDLDRLSFLQDDHDYALKLFFAERHTSQSNCRIDTTMMLKAAPLPATTALFD